MRSRLCAYLFRYVGSSYADNMCSITQKSNVKSKIKPPPPSAVQILDVNSFDDIVLVCHVPTPLML